MENPLGVLRGAPPDSPALAGETGSFTLRLRCVFINSSASRQRKKRKKERNRNSFKRKDGTEQRRGEKFLLRRASAANGPGEL